MLCWLSSIIRIENHTMEFIIASASRSDAMENVIGVITQVFLVLLTGGDKNTERMHAEANWKIARDYTPSRLRMRGWCRVGVHLKRLIKCSRRS